KLTGRPWPSMLVAGLFAVHPQHVESVAWIAERKDVLSGLFWILTIWAYAVYAEKPGFFRYLLVLLLLALGLLSKPMTVTLPCVLMLLDFWPLRRTKLIEPSYERPMKQWNLFVLIAEKIPMLAMSGGICAITYLAQREGGAMAANDSIPLAQRACNAVVAYA